MSIIALDQNTVKFLKTTQVITSVSYAVKELVENSLDAGAKNIEINLSDNGFAQIEVKDDGFGISKEDAPFMALSSYTSKIKDFGDLDKLQTHGFRGEALQALSEVSELTIITKSQNEEIATKYNIDSGGNIAKSEPCHRSVGTTVQAKGLFKKFYVRKQWLRNSKIENKDLKYLEFLLKSFGIINPDLRITYRRDKQIIFIKPSANNLTESITNILGKDVTSNLELVEETFPEGKIQLMLPKKELADPTSICQSRCQFIFVNKRILQHEKLQKLINKKIQEHYLKKGITITNCLFLLNIEVDPSSLDINLEPNKTKGFLKNESKIIELIETVAINFYQLDTPQENENENKKTAINGNLDQKNEKNSNNLDKENEWPACKKRKVESKRKSPVDEIPNKAEFSSITNGSENKKLPMIFSGLKGPILSESDSNSDNELNNHKERRSVMSKKGKEFVRKEHLNETEPEGNKILPCNTETLSQLPVVDLGEEFSQISKENMSGELQSNGLLSPERMDDMDPLLLELDLDEFDYLNAEPEKSKPAMKQSTLSLDTSQTGELSFRLNKDSSANDNLNQLTPNSWSRGQIPGLVGGTNVSIFGSNEKEKPSSFTAFNVFFSQVRSQIVEENPEMSVPQIASLLTNRWKEMSHEEKAQYYKIAQNRMQQEKQLKGEKKEKREKEKTKKRLLEVLNNLKTNSKEKKSNETMRKRTIAEMETNIKMLTEKFNRIKSAKKSVVIGPIKPSMWIVKISSQFWLLDVAEMFEKLDFTEHSSNETNAETLEKLLKRWTLEKDDMSVLHLINQDNSIQKCN